MSVRNSDSRESTSNCVRGGYDQSVTQQEARMRGNLDYQRLPAGYPPTIYGMAMGRAAPSLPNYGYSPPTVGYSVMPTPSGSVGYYVSPLSNYTFSPPGYSNLPTPSTSDRIPEPRASDEDMPDQEDYYA
jgi:hypothetical protein